MNANVRAAASAFADARLLAEFHTTLDTTDLARIAPTVRLRRALERRAVPASVREYTTAHASVEIARLLLQRFAPQTVRGIAAIDASSRVIDRAVATRISADSTGVYAYEDSAVESFRRATKLDVPRIYELPIGYWRAAELVFAEEVDRNPQWVDTLTNRNLRNESQRRARKDEEIECATGIIVASQFTAKTLSHVAGGLPPVVCIPYGCPPVVATPSRGGTGALRVLFVGGLTQRKGISYLFEAMDLVGSAATLTIIGSRSGESSALDHSLKRHNWLGSLPHSAVLNAMQSHDVLVFPSLFEGFGMVLTEALSQGLPVITTPNTAGPDLITEGEDGWIVPIRSSAAIADRILRLCDDRELLNSMKESALAKAKTRSWDRYASDLVGSTWDLLEIAGRSRDSL